jgi:hypothetical protein
MKVFLSSTAQDLVAYRQRPGIAETEKWLALIG